MGAANVGPEFTMNEYDALAELEELEKKLYAEGKVAQLSNMTQVLWQCVYESNRWKKWLHGEEVGKDLKDCTPERQLWLVKTGCRYIWQKPEALVARQALYENLERLGIHAEEVVLMRIEHNMDKYYNAFNIVNLNDYLK
jgi:tagatose-1,6-bisphosphate aldolase non-catalytic subunit AgaZ/GatZ